MQAEILEIANLLDKVILDLILGYFSSLISCRYIHPPPSEWEEWMEEKQFRVSLWQYGQSLFAHSFELKGWNVEQKQDPQLTAPAKQLGELMDLTDIFKKYVQHRNHPNPAPADVLGHMDPIIDILSSVPNSKDPKPRCGRWACRQ